MYIRYHDVWWAREIVTFCRLAPCEAANGRLFTHVNNLCLSIHECAKRQVKVEAEDHWTPQTRRMRHDGYVQSNSAVGGSSNDSVAVGGSQKSSGAVDDTDSNAKPSECDGRVDRALGAQALSTPLARNESEPDEEIDRLRSQRESMQKEKKCVSRDLRNTERKTKTPSLQGKAPVLFGLARGVRNAHADEWQGNRPSSSRQGKISSARQREQVTGCCVVTTWRAMCL